MLTDLTALEHWLENANSGDVLIFCEGGNLDLLARRIPELKKVYERLKQAHDERLVYIDVDNTGRYMARMIRPGASFNQQDISNVIVPD